MKGAEVSQIMLDSQSHAGGSQGQMIPESGYQPGWVSVEAQKKYGFGDFTNNRGEISFAIVSMQVILAGCPDHA